MYEGGPRPRTGWHPKERDHHHVGTMAGDAQQGVKGHRSTRGVRRLKATDDRRGKRAPAANGEAPRGGTTTMWAPSRATRSRESRATTQHGMCGGDQ